MPTRVAGAIITTLIADNHASKLAVKMAKALLRPRDELQLVTVVMSEDSISYGNDLLAPYLQEKCSNSVTPVVSNCYDGRDALTLNPNCCESCRCEQS